MDKGFGNIDRERLEKALGSAASKQGINAEGLKKAMKEGDPQRLMEALDSAQAKKLEALLKDKEALRELLNSPAAARLIRELTK